MRNPRILWATPYSLHDSTSGAARQARAMLESLANHGVDVYSLSATVVDNPVGKACLAAHEEESIKRNSVWFFLSEGGIQYKYLRTPTTVMSQLTDHWMRTFFNGFMVTLQEFRPDMIMMYSGGCLGYAMRAEAAMLGIPCVYLVCNANHKNFTFPYCDLVITDSKFNAEFYQKNNRTQVHPVGTFIEAEKVVAVERKPTYITFVNPVAAKGVSIFARLAMMAKTELSEAQFLVVQARGRWPDTTADLRDSANPDFRVPVAELTNVTCMENQTDIRQVYAQTKIVLVPSLGNEGWGRVATEAMMNGIPVIAAKIGGLPEAVGSGGIIVPCPATCHADYNRLPTEDEVRPWLHALKHMLSQPAPWEELARKAATEQSIEKSTERVLDVLTPLLNRRASLSPKYVGITSGSIC